MKTIDIENNLSKYLFTDSTSTICKRFMGAGYSEMDIMKITKTDYIYEYELKISRNDFNNELKNYEENIDRRKYWKHQMMSESFNNKKKKYKRKINNSPNKYYFVCPTNLIKIDELLEYQGLIYTDENFKFTIIKEAKFIHKNKISLKTIKRIMKTLSERDVYDGISKITYELKNK